MKNYTLTYTLEMAYPCCFTLGGYLDILDFLQKMFFNIDYWMKFLYSGNTSQGHNVKKSFFIFSSIETQSLYFFILVPTWIFEGGCNIREWNKRRPDVDNSKTTPIPDLMGVEYFPHNDTLHISYECTANPDNNSNNNSSKSKVIRKKICTFQDNVGNIL